MFNKEMKCERCLKFYPALKIFKADNIRDKLVGEYHNKNICESCLVSLKTSWLEDELKNILHRRKFENGN